MTASSGVHNIRRSKLCGTVVKRPREGDLEVVGGLYPVRRGNTAEGGGRIPKAAANVTQQRRGASLPTRDLKWDPGAHSVAPSEVGKGKKEQIGLRENSHQVGKADRGAGMISYLIHTWPEHPS